MERDLYAEKKTSKRKVYVYIVKNINPSGPSVHP